MMDTARIELYRRLMAEIVVHMEEAADLADTHLVGPPRSPEKLIASIDAAGTLARAAAALLDKKTDVLIGLAWR